jgi:PLD-like domain
VPTTFLMKPNEIDRQIIAGDVYPRWKKLVRSAKNSITVFTPYLDNTLIRLLQNKPYDLSFENINVITEFNSEAFITGQSRLTTLERLIKNGTQVKSLQHLHAKVLLVDNAQIALGSQNFTQRGRKNKEASIRFGQGIEHTNLLVKLNNWDKEAVDIDLELVQELLKKIPKLRKKHRALVKQSEEIFLNSKEEFEARQRESIWKDILKAEKRSRFQLHHGEIYASIKYIEQKTVLSNNIHCLQGGYSTLVPDQGYDLTMWQLSDDKESIKPKELKRLNMYPILNADTLQMGFARVGKKRITYIRDGVDLTDEIISVGDHTLSVIINFPNRKTKKVNIEIILKESETEHLTVRVIFNGTKYRIADWKYSPSSTKDFIQTLNHELFRKKMQFHHSFEKLFASFRFATLHRNDKNIKHFLSGGRYRISLIEFADNPFLIVKNVDE